MKNCRKCLELKQAGEFGVQRATCKKCYVIQKAKYDKRYREKNSDRICQYKKEHYTDNKHLYYRPYGERKAAAKKYYSKNKDRLKQESAKWAKENIGKMRVFRSKWAKDNKGCINAKTAKYRADKLQATPSWANLMKIKEFYKNCPEGYHVDHVIPLRGKNVRGLHIEYNLQYLTAKENIKKSNKLIGEFLCL